VSCGKGRLFGSAGAFHRYGKPSFADLDGHEQPKEERGLTGQLEPVAGTTWYVDDGSCSGFVSCFANALVSNNLAGIGRQDPANSSGTIGAAVGDFVSVVLGAVEVVAGGAAQGGGVAACGTGVGCLATVPAVAAGTVAEVFANLLRAAANQTISEGEFREKFKNLEAPADDPMAKIAYENAAHFWGNFHERNPLLMRSKPDLTVVQ